VKKYKFELQTVLEVKQHLEKQRQQQLAALESKLNAEKKALLSLIQEQSLCRQKRMTIEQEGAQSHDILMIESYLQKLKHTIQLQQRTVNQLKMAFNKKQQELINVMREKKSLEKYKEKKQGEYDKSVLSLEQKLLDELAIRKFQRL